MINETTLEYLSTKGHTPPRTDQTRIAYATDWLSRLRGLLGTSREEWDNAQLIIDPCQSIHTMGMRYPIDVAFIDPRMRVLSIRMNVPPRRIVLGPALSLLVIERPARKTEWYQEGEKLSWLMHLRNGTKQLIREDPREEES